MFQRVISHIINRNFNGLEQQIYHNLYSISLDFKSYTLLPEPAITVTQFIK